MQYMKKPIKPADLKTIENEYSRVLKSGGHWISKQTNDYPSLLQPLEDAPPVISALGKIELLQRPMIGIVGARNRYGGA
jgi:DNA processing protein